MAAHAPECEKADPGSLCDCDCAGAKHAVARTRDRLPGAGAVSRRARRIAEKDGRPAVTGNVPPAAGQSQPPSRRPRSAKADFKRWKKISAAQPGTPEKGKPLAVYGSALHIADETAVSHQHLADLETVPETWHNELYEHVHRRTGHGVYVGDLGVPDLDQMSHLSGVQPRGWPPGKTWDDVPGAYDPGDGKLLLGGGGQKHGSTNLATHEFGHGADRAAGAAAGYHGTPASWLPDYDALHRQHIQPVVGQNAYYMQPGGAGHEEAWAEGFAAWVGGLAAGTAAADIAQLFRTTPQGGHDLADYYAKVQTDLDTAQKLRAARNARP